MLHVSKSFRDFLYGSGNPIANFLSRAIYYQGRGFEASRLMIRTDEVNYLTLRDDGTMSFLPKNKPHIVNDDGRWQRDGRQNGSAGRVIRKVLTEKASRLFKDADFTQFVNSYKAVCEAEAKTFEVKPNVSIPSVYCMDREYGGTLGDSCMNGDRDYVEMYRHCPHVSILCLLNKDGELSGRALLWNTEDGTLMDRVYVAKDHYYDLFLDYADKNGYIRKVEYKSYRDKDYFVKEGNVFRKSYKIATATQFDYYPYMDTFTYGGDGWLTNSSSVTYMYEYCNTDGTRNGDEERHYCEINGEYYPESEMRYIDRGRYRDCYIHESHAVICETDNNHYWEDDEQIVYMSGRGYYRRDDEDICEVDGDWHFSEDCHWSERDERYYLSDDCIWSDKHEDYLNIDEAVTVDGKVYHEDDVERCN